MSSIRYKVNGRDFEEFGVTVTSSSGYLDALKPKEPKKYDWGEIDGEVVDLSKRTFDARAIELSCFIKANSRVEFIVNLQAFFAEWDKNGRQRLTVDLGIDKLLVYDVYRTGEVDVNKDVGANGSFVGEFTLKLKEPDSNKMVLKHVCSNIATPASFSFQTMPLNSIVVGWGDGAFEEVLTTSFSHKYSKAGTYYITVGGLGRQSNIQLGNTTLVWQRL